MIGADSKQLLYFIVFIWVVHVRICVQYTFVDIQITCTYHAHIFGIYLNISRHKSVMHHGT